MRAPFLRRTVPPSGASFPASSRKSDVLPACARLGVKGDDNSCSRHDQRTQRTKTHGAKRCRSVMMKSFDSGVGAKTKKRVGTGHSTSDTR